MNELAHFPIQYDQEMRPMVSGLALHRALEIKTPYRKWFPRICEYGYEENGDYRTVETFVRRSTDGTIMPGFMREHWLSLGMAKEICLMQKTDIGRQIRQRFIAAEEAMHQAALSDAKKLQTYSLRLAANQNEMNRLKAIAMNQDKKLAVQAHTIAQQNYLIGARDATIEEQTETILQMGTEIKKQQTVIGEMGPKADFCEKVLNAPNTVSITAIAKGYGWSGKKMNAFLHDKGVQYKLKDGWVLYAAYVGKGYTRSATYIRQDGDGTQKVRITMQWTQKGRIFIHRLMREAGYAKPNDGKEEDNHGRKRKNTT